MKAVILVGGYGTRLRPLTLTVPKPLVPFCNQPMIEYQIRALAEIGVTQVILAVAHEPDTMSTRLRELEAEYGLRIVCSIEHEPLLTGGPLKLAEGLLNADVDGEKHPELFFVLNSDIITEYPFEDLLATHLIHQGEGTICLTQVQDPSAYGVVLTQGSPAKVTCFIEKPKDWVGNMINAGIYIFDRRVLKRIALAPTSLERETFPTMANAGVLYAYHHSGYWADIGKPRDYLDGMKLYLQSVQKTAADQLSRPADDNYEVIEPVLVHETASIGRNCKIGPFVTVDRGATIGEGCRISNTTVMENVKILSYAKIDDSIIGWQSFIDMWCRIDGLSVLGQQVSIGKEVYINGALILPFKNQTQNIHDPGAIIL